MSKSIHRSIYKPAIGCMALLALITSPSVAQTTTKSFTTTVSLNSLGNFTVPDFNSSLGSLDSINITLSAGGNTSLDIPAKLTTNLTDTSLTQNLENFTLGPGNSPNNSIPSTGAPIGGHGPGVPATSPNTLPENSGSTTTHYSPFQNGLTTTEQVNSSLFGSWENQSGGNVDLTHSNGNIICQGASFGNNLFNGKTGTEKVTIQYVYTAQTTPEPAGKYLAGMALGAAVLLLLRRKRQVAALA